MYIKLEKLDNYAYHGEKVQCGVFAPIIVRKGVCYSCEIDFEAYTNLCRCNVIQSTIIIILDGDLKHLNDPDVVDTIKYLDSIIKEIK